VLGAARDGRPQPVSGERPSTSGHRAPVLDAAGARRPRRTSGSDCQSCSRGPWSPSIASRSPSHCISAIVVRLTLQRSAACCGRSGSGRTGRGRSAPVLRCTPLQRVAGVACWEPSDVLGVPVVPSQVQGQAAMEVARQRAVHRDRLLASSPSITVTMLAQGRAVEPDHVRSWLRRESSDGRVVTVEHDDEVLIPRFQLDADLRLRDDVAAVTGRLSAAGVDGWAAWAWWVGRRATLDASPIDLLDAGQHERLREAVSRLVDPHA